MGWDLVNMTAYPEGWLARELGLCYANVSLVTDYDVGVAGDDAHAGGDRARPCWRPSPRTSSGSALLLAKRRRAHRRGAARTTPAGRPWTTRRV